MEPVHETPCIYYDWCTAPPACVLRVSCTPSSPAQRLNPISLCYTTALYPHGHCHEDGINHVEVVAYAFQWYIDFIVRQDTTAALILTMCWLRGGGTLPFSIGRTTQLPQDGIREAAGGSAWRGVRVTGIQETKKSSNRVKKKKKNTRYENRRWINNSTVVETCRLHWKILR